MAETVGAATEIQKACSDRKGKGFSLPPLLLCRIFTFRASVTSRAKPSQGRKAYSARANRMTYLVLGWSQIVGGLVIGLLLYVVGGIGQVVVDVWNEKLPIRQLNGASKRTQ